jgi:regulation of enolase protein 1 (concanavalin A-like superfamily)
MSFPLRRLPVFPIAILLALAVAMPVRGAHAQSKLSLPSLPGEGRWLNPPQSFTIADSPLELGKRKVLIIASGKQTDWFVDPFNGTVSRSAPILLFSPTPDPASSPDSDYVLSARVTVKFAAKWDAGALMLWGDDHHWAKLSFELSPDRKPTLVTVVTRGVSDDCNSSSLPGDSVYLRIARSSNQSGSQKSSQSSSQNSSPKSSPKSSPPSQTYVFYYSTDGSNWHILRTFNLGPDLPTDVPIAIGFESQSPAGSGSVATFSAISYEKKRLGNIYK